jgi:hypothetical protein
MDTSERSTSSITSSSNMMMHKNNNSNNMYVSPLLQRRDSFDQAGRTICRRIQFCLPNDMPNVTNNQTSAHEFLAAKIVQEQMCSSNSSSNNNRYHWRIMPSDPLKE